MDLEGPSHRSESEQKGGLLAGPRGAKSLRPCALFSVLVGKDVLSFLQGHLWGVLSLFPEVHTGQAQLSSASRAPCCDPVASLPADLLPEEQESTPNIHVPLGSDLSMEKEKKREEEERPRMAPLLFHTGDTD